MIIPKIEIKITANELKEAYAALDYEMPNIPYTGEKAQTMKSYYSLLEAVRIKLAKKVLSHKDKQKPFKLSLHFFEANCIHKTMLVIELSHYAQNFFNKLDQKIV
ncbi:hypothetical protein KO504_16890 [Winogradskyella psychrotolerans]|uniref:hypothetical protein n=1 Tax=Winogradskyella psychrotolerans TaxID=1344585 RepID=UPI001C07A6BE|nr:hypothetical protein [Winogradskyella psychrotolerans]MBU2923028.1 hypothetical protein [Winogradskyella psychrotolerans]